MSETAINTLTLPARLDLQSAKPLKADLVERQDGDVCLDAANVEWVGGLGVQLLLSAQAAWQANNHSLMIENASEAFVEGLRRLGVTADLMPVEEC